VDPQVRTGAANVTDFRFSVCPKKGQTVVSPVIAMLGHSHLDCYHVTPLKSGMKKELLHIWYYQETRRIKMPFKMLCMATNGLASGDQ